MILSDEKSVRITRDPLNTTENTTKGDTLSIKKILYIMSASLLLFVTDVWAKTDHHKKAKSHHSSPKKHHKTSANEHKSSGRLPASVKKSKKHKGGGKKKKKKHSMNQFFETQTKSA